MGVEAFYAAATHTLFALVGLCVGSFLNVAAYRLPLGLRLSKPSSHCPQCKRYPGPRARPGGGAESAADPHR